MKHSSRKSSSERSSAVTESLQRSMMIAAAREAWGPLAQIDPRLASRGEASIEAVTVGSGSERKRNPTATVAVVDGLKVGNPRHP